MGMSTTTEIRTLKFNPYNDPYFVWPDIDQTTRQPSLYLPVDLQTSQVRYFNESKSPIIVLHGVSFWNPFTIEQLNSKEGKKWKPKWIKDELKTNYTTDFLGRVKRDKQL